MFCHAENVYYRCSAWEQEFTFRSTPGRTGIAMMFSRCYNSDKKCLHRLVCLHTWSLASRLLLEVLGPLEGGVQLVELDIWEAGFEADSLTLLSALSLFPGLPSGECNNLMFLMAQMQPYLWLCYSSHDGPSSQTVNQNTSFLKLLLLKSQWQKKMQLICEALQPLPGTLSAPAMVKFHKNLKTLTEGEPASSVSARNIFYASSGAVLYL